MISSSYLRNETKNKRQLISFETLTAETAHRSHNKLSKKKNGINRDQIGISSVLSKIINIKFVMKFTNAKNDNDFLRELINIVEQCKINKMSLKYNRFEVINFSRIS